MASTLYHQTCSFVDIAKVDSRIHLDIRYATPHNFLGFSVYSQAICYLHRDVAHALSRVQDELDSLQLRLKVYDGYRPLHVQQVMWDKIQDERYVANPATTKGSHTRGTAVDVTLMDLHGNELDMPTAFDDFTDRAHSDFSSLPAPVIHNRALLKTVMERQSFTQLPSEWWHFNYNGWQNDALYPPLNLTFEELRVR